MRGKAAILGLCLALGLGMAGCNDAIEGLEVFEAVLSGQNEVPVRSSAGSGRAQFVSDGTTVTFSVEIDDLDNITQGHIHLERAGANGGVRVWLWPAVTARATANPPISVSDRQTFAQGTFTQADILAGVTMAQLLDAMRSGGAYVNFHSSQFPAGEIRGQIAPVSID